MPNFLCTTCGSQFAESATEPQRCPICEDPRQYLKPTGQQWTTFERLRKSHRNTLRHEEPGLISLGIEPHFAIGQRPRRPMEEPEAFERSSSPPGATRASPGSRPSPLLAAPVRPSSWWTTPTAASRSPKRWSGSAIPIWPVLSRFRFPTRASIPPSSTCGSPVPGNPPSCSTRSRRAPSVLRPAAISSTARCVLPTSRSVHRHATLW